MEMLLTSLRAAAESTRLRLLAICAEGDVTVTELTRILGQSQPRISRHLKLLCEAGLVDRYPEGSWVFYRLADSRTRGGQIARDLAAMIPEDDERRRRDLDALQSEKDARAEAAQTYFRANAAEWDSLRSLHVDEREVELLGREQLRHRYARLAAPQRRRARLEPRGARRLGLVGRRRAVVERRGVAGNHEGLAGEDEVQQPL